MTIYIILFICLAFFSFIESIVDIKRKNVIVLVVGFILMFWLMSWLRWERGTDWGNYIDYFNNFAVDYNSAHLIGFETGFIHLNYWVRQFSENYTVLLFIMATVAQLFFGIAVLKISRKPIISLFVTYSLYLAFIFLTRQVFANTLVLFGCYYIIQRRFWPFAFWIFIASLFHSSALIFLFAYWIYNWRFKTSTLLLSLTTSVVVGLLINQIMIGVLGNMQGFIGAKLSMYLNEGYELGDSAQSPIRVLVGGVVNRGGLLVLIILMTGRNRLVNIQINGLINIYAFGFILFLITTPIATAMTRIAGYYDMIIIFLLPLALDHFKIKSNRVIAFGILTLYFAYRLFVGALSGEYGDLYTPYNTIFTKERIMEIG